MAPANEIRLPDGSTMNPLKMRSREFPKGTLFVTRTGGGGGYGNPMQRPFDEVARDVRSGLVTAKKALEVYGVAFTPDLEVDINRSTARAPSS